MQAFPFLFLSFHFNEAAALNLLFFFQYIWIYFVKMHADISNAAVLMSSKQTQSCDICSMDVISTVF